MTAENILRATCAAFLLLGLVLLSSCRGIGNMPGLSANRPSITDLSTHSASIGDSLDVLGLNFGPAQGDSSVRLKGVDFSVNSWSDTKISDIDVDHDGTVPVEVFNSDSTQSQVVEGTPIDGQWFFFLWTGALGEGENQVVANSGIFSELYTFTIGSGQPGSDPVADLQATPTAGDPPLEVSFDASGSTDDGTIVKYEFDFGEGGGWENYGMFDTAQHTYNSDGTYNARLRVTDDDSNTAVDLATINVGSVPTYEFQVGVTINFSGFHTTIPLTMAKLWDHEPSDPSDPDSFDIGFTGEPEDGVEQFITFEDVPAGQIWVSVARVVTDWDNGDSSFGVYGPYMVPDTTIIHVVGDQYGEPPPPGG